MKELWDKIPKLAQFVIAVGVLWGALNGLAAAVPSAFHTDAESAVLWAGLSEQEACSQVVDLYWRIHQGETDLADPRVDEWYKAKLRKDLPRWRELLASLRRDYPQCDKLIPV